MCIAWAWQRLAYACNVGEVGEGVGDAMQTNKRDEAERQTARGSEGGRKREDKLRLQRTTNTPPSPSPSSRAIVPPPHKPPMITVTKTHVNNLVSSSFRAPARAEF